MIAPLAKLMDWSAVQLVTLIMPARAFNSRLEEALQFLKSPDFVSTDSQPAQVEFNGSRDFRFPTPRPCDFTENNVVHGRFYRCGERWQDRPVVVLLHGSGDSLIPSENILLIEGIYDLMCPKNDIENLWQSWGQPDIWRLSYGHTGVCCGFVPGLPGRVLCWLAPRMNK